VGPIILHGTFDPERLRRVAAKQTESIEQGVLAPAMRSADAIGDGDYVRILPRYSEAKTEFEFATRLAAEQFVEAEKGEHRPGRRRKVA
jgi:hypothetical protein